MILPRGRDQPIRVPILNPCDECGDDSWYYRHQHPSVSWDDGANEFCASQCFGHSHSSSVYSLVHPTLFGNFAFSMKTGCHEDRSSALHSQSLVLILAALKSLRQTSLNRRRGRLVFLFPDTSSPYRRSLGMRHGLILFTCPSHLRRLSLRII